uniref:Uncharacterized protein n=1 Tax=Cyclophora tenuis TaxID=216820 RepID=A0A7S1GPX0_CYCTE
MERLSSDFFGMEQSCWSQTKQLLMRFFGLIISVIGIMVATIILLEGDGETTPCPRCEWLSCVPFPPWEGQSDKWWYCDDCGRVTADIIAGPNLHLQINCPDKTSVAVELDPDTDIDHESLEKELPTYCRELCPKTDVRF